MSLTETVAQDRIEIVDTGTYKVLQIRTATIIAKSGVELTRSFHRHICSPNDDISNESDEVKSLAAIYFTDSAKAAQTAAEAASSPGE